jgi:hypothetical protein
MPIRYTPSLVCIASLAALVAAPLRAQGALPAYGTGSVRYRVVNVVKSTQTAMGQTQEVGSTSDQVSTVVIAKAGSGLTQTMTVDSASFTSTPPSPSPDAEILGLKFTATMGADGKVVSSVITDKTGAATTGVAATALRSFLPRLKVGATTGATWVDTSTTVRKQNGADVTTTITTTFTLVGDTTVAGAHAWKITSASTGKLSGAGTQQGADYTISGLIVGHGTIVIGAGATMLGAELMSDGNLLVDVPMAGMQIPIAQKQMTTITKLP